MEEDSTAFSPPVTRNRSRPFSYPETIKGEVVDDYLGTEVADSYRCMEDLDSPDVAPWVAAQNTVTFEYLESISSGCRPAAGSSSGSRNSGMTRTPAS
jgi:hypothetical protein